jgi:hypothetical protein
MSNCKWILVWTTKISPKHATTKAIPITSWGSYIALSNSRSLQLLEGTYKSLEEFKSIVSLLYISFDSNSRTENTHTNAPCESRPPRSLLMKQKHVKSTSFCPSVGMFPDWKNLNSIKMLNLVMIWFCGLMDMIK